MKKIRLTEEEINNIKEIAKDVFGKDVKVWIFGSRVNPNLKGGDIDLYIETANIENLIDKKLTFLVKLKDRIGEQKIDLIIKPLECNELICEEIKKSGVEL